MKYVYLLGGVLLLGVLILLVRQWLIRQVDRRISGYQSDLLNRHIEEVEQMYRQVRGWRHDYRNHIQVMKAHLDAGRYGSLSSAIRRGSGFGGYRYQDRKRDGRCHSE